ncbi:MAG: exo-alpha-sialidase [Gammaproteobacteria bacterium]|nr:exo-alpha-sialidase [Gammaproteobacteria bacterium]
MFLRVLIVAGWYCLAIPALLAANAEIQPDTVVIASVPAQSENYVGSPSIVILDNGDYIASHVYFGDGVEAENTAIYRSADKGNSWEKLITLRGQFWSTLFTHKGSLYIIGTQGSFGPIIIRRSDDGGETWTEARDEEQGLISDYRPYHSASVPVIEYNGRLWRGFEFKDERAVVIKSIDVDGDLLRYDNWHQTELLHEGSPSTWLEGNLLLTPDGGLASILRREFRNDTAAIMHLNDDASQFTHNPQLDVIAFPGGGSKFTIRFDEESRRYWSLVNKPTEPEAFRNKLVLVSSSDLYHWRIDRTIAYSSDSENKSWQYADWQFDGKDIVAVLRTADEYQGQQPQSAYLTNLLTFILEKSVGRSSADTIPA